MKRIAGYRNEEKDGEYMAKINHDKFVADMIRYASSAESPDHIINQILQYICENLQSDRAYIFEDNLDGTFDNTYEWCREGVTKEIDNLKRVPYEGMLDVWFEEYEKSHNIMIYDIEEYRQVSEPMYQLLKPQGIQTLVTGPIEINGKYIGFYGVDNPPIEFMDNISILIDMMEFVMSMMIRIRNYTKQIEESATKDQLTKCYNRKALRWAYAGDFDKNNSIAIIMCDLNGLKRMNDTKGHEAGDKYLCDAAEGMISCFGEKQVYRVGGDEFVIVLLDVAKEEVERLVERLKMYMELKQVSVAIGMAYRHNSKEPFENILRDADKKMYVEKKQYHAEHNMGS